MPADRTPLLALAEPEQEALLVEGVLAIDAAAPYDLVARAIVVQAERAGPVDAAPTGRCR